MMLTLGSLFDGIGGWLLAAVHNGVKPIWSSEIEKFPMAVTKHHFPDVIQLGDITKLDGATLPPVDIICAGSPCQDLSVAGKREGLKGERSGLFINAINIVRRMRDATNGRYPRFFVWENVTGSFSSNAGLDYKTLLEKITETEIPIPASGRWANAGMVRSRKCDVAWRVLDAQYWGVPQRRKRIFLVADFAESKRCAGEILFVEPCLPGDNKPLVEAEKSITADAETSVGDASKHSTDITMSIVGGQNVTEIYDMHHAQDVIRTYINISPALISRMGTGGNNVPILTESIPKDAMSTTGGAEAYAIGNGQMNQAMMTDKVGALNCMHDQIAVMQKLVEITHESI